MRRRDNLLRPLLLLLPLAARRLPRVAACCWLMLLPVNLLGIGCAPCASSSLVTLPAIAVDEAGGNAVRV